MPCPKVGERIYDMNQNLDAGAPSDCKASADRSAVNRRSALWAAYGDALGWISELVDAKGLKRRTGGDPLVEPIEWKRRVGGRSGVSAPLPVGCYSDDSQLRLATSRAIRADNFDVEAFAKVELPVWLGYALGGGKSTTAAAEHLGKTQAGWNSNRYKGWTNSGGNGAAMRIQPHVWAASAPSDPSTFLQDVVRNAICTHSHPNGLLGAVMHALALAHTMSSGRIPSPNDMMDAANLAENILQMMDDDFDFRLWRVAFEAEAGAFADGWAQAVAECRKAIKSAEAVCDMGEYSELANRLDLRDPSRVGSGVLTSIAAVGLTWSEPRPREAMRIAANELGTDTDTIATMAGAIMGAAADEDPPVDVMDADLFRSEANRLAEIALGGRPKNHGYPDLLHWNAPKTRADSMAQGKDGGLYILGLGRAEAIGEPIRAQRGFSWQWVALESGQTLFVKRRESLQAWDGENAARPLVPSLTTETAEAPADLKEVPRHPDQARDGGVAAIPLLPSRKTDSAEAPMDLKEVPRNSDSPVDLDAFIEYLQRHRDDDMRVGRAIRGVAKRGTPSQFMKLVAEAYDALNE